MPEHSRSIGNISKGIIKIPGPIDPFHSSDLPWPPEFQTPAESKKQGYGLLPFLQGSNTTRSSLQRGDSVVEGPPSSIEWKGPFPEASRAHHRDRCISKRVGGILQGMSTRDPWCLEEKRLQIICLELLAGSLVIKTFTKRKACAYVKVTDRKCCSSSIHQQDGKHSLSGAIQFSFKRMRLMHSSPHEGVSPTPTWVSKCKSGQGFTPSARLQRLETGYSSFPIDSTERGPLASRLTYQLQQFVSWRPDPLAIHSDVLQ